MAETATYPQTPSETEKWLREGRPIEFPKSAPVDMTSADWILLRTVPAELLRSLFDKVTRVCNLPVKLRNVMVEGNVRLAYRSSKFEFAIIDSDFQGLADFSFFTFDGATDFMLSRFRQGAKFNSSRFKYDLRLSEAVFEKEASFQAIEIQGRMFSLGTRFQNANFANAKFVKSAVFKSKVETGAKTIRTEFLGDSKFPDTRFESSAEFDGARFAGALDFSRSVMGANAIFRPARPKDEGSPLPVEFVGETLFRDVTVAGTADFNAAQFLGDARFQQTRIGGNLFCGSLRIEEGDIRPRFEGAAVFDGLQVIGRIVFDGAEFATGCSFEAAQVGGNALFRGLRGTDTALRFGGDVNFLDIKIDGTADFSGASFAGGAVFRRAEIGGSAFFRALPGKTGPVQTLFAGNVVCDDVSVRGAIFFQGAVFRGSSSFRSLQVGNNGSFGHVVLNDRCVVTQFQKDAVFADAHFGGGVNCSGIHFQREAVWDRVLVGGAVNFGPAELSGIFTISQFDGNLSFRDADLKGRVDFSAACFLGNAIFTRAKFGSGAFFSSVRRNGNILLTRFAGEQLRFYRAEIQGDMEFEGTEFGQQADFEAVRVKGNAIFRAAQFRESGQILAAIAITTFHGGGRFLDATIEGVADFSGAVFAGKSLFNRIKVGGPAFFRNLEDTRHEAVPTFQEASFVGAVFSGGADFDRAHFQGSVSFSEASFGASTRFSRIRCDKQITFDLIEVNGTATFQRSRFEGDVSFQDARISTANFGESSEDKGVFLKSVDLRGFTYVRVIGDWRTLFARISTQDLQPYAQLEKFFRSVGNERDADSVYLARRDVDRKKLRELIRTRSSTGNHLQWQLVRNAFKFAEDSILRWFFNYGVPSYRMVWLACLLFLAGGLTLTTPGALEFSSIPQSFLNAGSITRFLHGIVTFASSLLPHTQEEQITQWRPSHNLLFQKWGPSFKQITLLLSFSVYGCVTLAVASLTGLIKRKQS